MKTPPQPRLPRATERAHDLVRSRLRPGDTALDATVGNGHDTLFLAALVGETGRVIGFDIQTEAIDATRRRLDEAGLGARVALHWRSHDSLAEVLEPDRKVHVAMFNLGYLPGGDKTVITRPETTIHALTEILDRLADGGLVTVVVYPGHPGGDAEARAVVEFAGSLDRGIFTIVCPDALDPADHRPFLVVIERRESVSPRKGAKDRKNSH